MAVCVQPCDLRHDDRGVLRVNTLGRTDPVAWPYECDIADHNTFHRNASCVWADAPPRPNMAAVTADLPLALSISTTNVEVLGVASLEVINLDPCRSASAIVATTLRWTVEPLLDAGESVNYILLRRVTGVGAPDSAQNQTWRDQAFSRSSRVAATQLTWRIDAIGPGSSQTVTVDMAGRADGSGEWLWSRAQALITAVVVVQT